VLGEPRKWNFPFSETKEEKEMKTEQAHQKLKTEKEKKNV